jgi:hypothetical protein
MGAYFRYVCTLETELYRKWYTLVVHRIFVRLWLFIIFYFRCMNELVLYHRSYTVQQDYAVLRKERHAVFAADGRVLKRVIELSAFRKENRVRVFGILLTNEIRS